MFSDNVLTEIKGNRESVGASIFNHKKNFINYKVEIKSGDVVYLSTDGFPDQFGGVQGKKLKWKGFRELLAKTAKKPLNIQKRELVSFFNDWKKGAEQLDDVCVVGVRL